MILNYDSTDSSINARRLAGWQKIGRLSAGFSHSNANAAPFATAHYWFDAFRSESLPDGAKDFDIRMPARNITSVTFGGEGLDRLFVTSAAQEHRTDDPLAGTLFEVPKSLLRGHKGLPTNKFSG